MYRFKKGQEIWFLEEGGIYKPTIEDTIRKCIYLDCGGDGILANGGSHRVQYVNKDGKLGLSRSLYTYNSKTLFDTLEELKEYLISKKLSEVNDLQTKIDIINSDIDYIKSLKDVKEDRESKLNQIL